MYEDIEKIRREVESQPWRQHEESYLRAYIASRTLLIPLQRAVHNVLSDLHDTSEYQLTVIALGSYGRLDASVDISDVDIILVRSNGTNIVDRFLQRLLLENKSLLFDHRDEIERGNFYSIPHHEICYPSITIEELLSDTELSRQRRMQVLFESRPIYGTGYYDTVYNAVLGYYRLLTTPASSFPPQKFQKDMDDFLDGFWKVIAESKSTSKRIGNIKIAKALLLREMYALTNRLTLAYVTLYVIRDSKELTEILTAPNFVKIYLWLGTRFIYNRLLKLSNPTQQYLVGQLIADMDEEKKRVACAITNTEVENLDIQDIVRGYVFNVLKEYDTLLRYLRHTDYLSYIKERDSNYMVWIKEPELLALQKCRLSLLEHFRSFAKVLNTILEVMELDGTLMHGYSGSALESIIRKIMEARPFYE